MVEQIGDQAQHIRQPAVLDFIFEIEDDVVTEAVPLESRGGSLEVLRVADQTEQAGVIVGIDIDAAERDLEPTHREGQTATLA